MIQYKQTHMSVPDTVPELKGEPKRRRLRASALVLATIAQVGLLGLFVLPTAATYAMGKTVTLDATLYDPRDPLKGEFVQLQYPSIERLNTTMRSFNDGEAVFVVLKKGKKSWVASRLSEIVPKVKSDEVFIEGKAKKSSIWSPPELSLGLDKFFVPEGVGAKVERGGQLSVELAVDSSGRAVMKRLLKDGKDVVQQ